MTGFTVWSVCRVERLLLSVLFPSAFFPGRLLKIDTGAAPRRRGENEERRMRQQKKKKTMGSNKRIDWEERHNN